MLHPSTSHRAGWSYVIHGWLYFHPSTSSGSSISAALCIQPKIWRARSFYLTRWLCLLVEWNKYEIQETKMTQIEANLIKGATTVNYDNKTFYNISVVVIYGSMPEIKCQYLYLLNYIWCDLCFERFDHLNLVVCRPVWPDVWFKR